MSGHSHVQSYIPSTDSYSHMPLHHDVALSPHYPHPYPFYPLPWMKTSNSSDGWFNVNPTNPVSGNLDTSGKLNF